MEIIFKNSTMKFARLENLYKEANNIVNQYVGTKATAGSSALTPKEGVIGNHLSGIAGKTLKFKCTLYGTTAVQNYLYAVLADANGIVKTGYGYGDAGFGDGFWTTGTTKEGTTYTKVISIPADVNDLYFTIRFSDTIYFDNIIITVEN